jgi:hypothetical protein
MFDGNIHDIFLPLTIMDQNVIWWHKKVELHVAYSKTKQSELKRESTRPNIGDPANNMHKAHMGVRQQSLPKTQHSS